MSYSPMATVAARHSTGLTVVDADDVQALLAALQDPDCRCILTETDDEPRSTSELSAACDLPLSTTYRKLDLLTEAGLLREGTRIRRSGKHTSEYSRAVDDVVVSVDVDDGIELKVAARADAESPVYAQAFGGQ
jgi:DNA-binding transcriptional ArsR family regulator